MAYYFFCVQQGIQSKSEFFASACPVIPEATAPYRLAYSGIHTLDMLSCILATFAMPAVNGAYRAYGWDFVFAINVGVLMIMLDSASLVSGSRILIVLVPMIVCIMNQIIGTGLCVPVYWLISLLFRTKATTNGKPCNRPDITAVRSILLAFVFTTTLPALYMMLHPSPYSIMTWNLFHVYNAIIQILYFAWTALGTSNLRKSVVSERETCPYVLDQSTQLLATFISALAHVPLAHTIFSAPSLIAAISSEILPSPVAYAPPHSAEYAFSREIRRFLQWDAIFATVATWIGAASSWESLEMETVVGLAVVSVILNIFLGLGAAMAVPFICKEHFYERKRMEPGQRKEMKKTTVKE